MITHSIIWNNFDVQLNKLKSFEFTKKIFDIILSNNSEPDCNIDLLAQRLCMTKSTLYNKLKRQTGLSPVEYVRSVRLHTSVRMMSDSEMSIKEIAYAAGFNDPKYFSRCFKRHFGVSPKEYKEISSRPASYQWLNFNMN